MSSMLCSWTVLHGRTRLCSVCCNTVPANSLTLTYATVPSTKRTRMPARLSCPYLLVAFKCWLEVVCLTISNITAELWMGLQVNSKPLYVAIAQKKSDRQRRLKTYFQQPPGTNFQNPQGMGMGMPYYPGASPLTASPTMYSCAVPSESMQILLNDPL